MAEQYSGLPAWQFMSPQKAQNSYGLRYRESLLAGDIHDQLVARQVAEIPMPISEGDFKRLIDAYEVGIAEVPEQLAQTFHTVDAQFGHEAGHVRKEAKFEGDVQVQDGKNIFHFNEYARRRWQQQFTKPSVGLKEFLEVGYGVHDAVSAVARQAISELEETHPGIMHAFYPGSVLPHSYLRIASYDVPAPGSNFELAKPHFDIGGITLQAFADTDGFWGLAPDTDERIDYPSHPGMAHLFAGAGFQNLYEGIDTPIRPLLHGVRAVGDLVSKRHAIILFIDTPLIDPQVQPSQTLPQIFGQPSSEPVAKLETS